MQRWNKHLKFNALRKRDDKNKGADQRQGRAVRRCDNDDDGTLTDGRSAGTAARRKNSCMYSHILLSPCTEWSSQKWLSPLQNAFSSALKITKSERNTVAEINCGRSAWEHVSAMSFACLIQSLHNAWTSAIGKSYKKSVIEHNKLGEQAHAAASTLVTTFSFSQATYPARYPSYQTLTVQELQVINCCSTKGNLGIVNWVLQSGKQRITSPSFKAQREWPTNSTAGDRSIYVQSIQ